MKKEQIKEMEDRDAAGYARIPSRFDFPIGFESCGRRLLNT